MYCTLDFSKGVSVLTVIGCVLSVPRYVDVVLWTSMRGRWYLMKGRRILKAVSLDILYNYVVRLM